MRVRGEDEEDERRDPRERVPDRRLDVPVARRERARRERREQVEERCGDEPRQRVPAIRAELSGRLPVISSPKKPGKAMHDAARDDGDDEERERVRAVLGAELPLRLGARQIRDDDHPERLRAQHEDEVDAVRGHEAVGLVVAPELVREVDAGERSGPAEGEV